MLLKRVGNVAASEVDIGPSLMGQKGIFTQAGKDFVDPTKLGEQHMPAVIPGKAQIIDFRAAQPSAGGFLLIQSPVGTTQLSQTNSRPQAGRTRSDDYNTGLHGSVSLGWRKGFLRIPLSGAG